MEKYNCHVVGKAGLTVVLVATTVSVNRNLTGVAGPMFLLTMTVARNDQKHKKDNDDNNINNNNKTHDHTN